jgi:hypothetical protein
VLSGTLDEAIAPFGMARFSARAIGGVEAAE